MHCTSPGKMFDCQKNANQNGPQGQKCMIGKSKTENMISEIVGGVNTIKSDETHTYDDPFELTDEWTSPIHIPRSKSWLCCPNSAQAATTNTNSNNCVGSFNPNEFNKSCEYSYLVTEAPKPQFGNFHVAALSALNNQVLELKTLLQNSDIEKETLKHQLKDAIEENDRSQRRLDSLSSTHESRITEMHCVIVELKKKLNTKHENAIIEENEAEGSVSELSFQEGSVYNSEMEEVHQSDSDRVPQQQNVHQENKKNQQISPSSLPPPAISSMKIQTLQEEILHLRAQVALLQSQLASKSDERLDEDYDLGDEDDEDDDDEEENLENEDEIESNHDKSNYTSDDLCETADIFDVQENVVQHPKAICKKTSNVIISPSNVDTQGKKMLCGIGGSMEKTKSNNEVPVAKMAERVKLRRTMEKKHLTGSDFTSSGGICTTEMAEHVVADMLHPENLTSTSDLTTSNYSNELQRLQRRIEHLKVQNSVLSLQMTECKQNCEHLYLLCGKYESNALALQQALNCSDRAIEAYDVMLALLESKLGILEDVPSSLDSRKAAESVARHLLKRLNSEKDILENSLGPWQDTILLMSNASSQNPWTEEDDLTLRNHVSTLKGQRASIQNTVVTLESPFRDDNTSNSRSKGHSKYENRRMDLETAILMQELMSMREDVSELKYRAEYAEREKMLAEQKLSALQEALIHLQSQLLESEALLAIANKDRSSFSEAEHAANIERELVETLARESRLKTRLQGLAGSLEAAARASEDRHSQVQTTVTELKQTNTNLNLSLERCKKKYQTKLRKLEQQILGMTLNPKSGKVDLCAAIGDVIPETTL